MVLSDVIPASAAAFLIGFGLATAFLRRRPSIKGAGSAATPAPDDGSESARLAARRELRRIMAQGNVLIWWAEVRRRGGDFTWKFDQSEEFPEMPLYRLTKPGDQSLWHSADIPELEAMRLRSRQAMASGAPGYRQEFRIVRDGQVHWLSESVAIQRVGPDAWSLFGAVADITPKREAIEAQRRSEAQLKAILERSDCMLWEARVVRRENAHDWHFQVPDSGLARRIFGRNREFAFDGSTGLTASGRLFGAYETPDQKETDERAATAFRDNIPGYEQEYRLVSPQRKFWLHERVSITPVGPGEWKVVGLVVDATERHEMDEACKASDARLQEIVNRLDCILWQARVTQEPGQAEAWRFFPIPPSRLYRRIFGHDPRQDNPFFWSPNETPDLDQMNRRSAAALASGAPGYEQEFRTSASDGQTFWLREQVSITPIGPGEWHLVGIITDVSARRSAEAALAAEKERLAVTLTAMDEGVITVDTQARVQFMNPVAERLTGCAPGRGIDRPLRDIFPIGEGRPERFEEALAVAGVLEKGLTVNLAAHTALRGATGSLYQVEGCCAPVRNDSGGIVGAVLIFRDVTGRQRLEMELQRASKLESIGVLAGGIAHDFNNLLTAILGNLTLAGLDAGRKSSTQEFLDGAQAAAMRARDLTQQLLTFAKGGDPVRSAVHLPTMVEEVARFAVRGSRVRCEFELASDLWPVDADKGQVGQVMQNLVINAAQSMPEGGVIRIGGVNEALGEGSPAPLAPGHYVRLYVADAGTGIPPEHLAKIFEPYFTTKKQGHGLGLATVYSIVKKHKGHVSVESELGRGTIFHIWLPALPGQKIEEPKPAAKAPAPLSGRILLMDDEPAIRLAASRMLERLGFEAETASEGSEAVEKFRLAQSENRKFDAVVMDLTVPGGMGGCEALVEMLKIDPRLKAIVSSGYSSDAVMANYRAYGFRGMVAKPYGFDDFSRILREVLGSEAA